MFDAQQYVRKYVQVLEWLDTDVIDRMADIIVVLDSAHVAEVGSHDELMARGGHYAELYQIQARAYQ